MKKLALALVLVVLCATGASAAKNCPGIDGIPRNGLIMELKPGNYTTRKGMGYISHVWLYNRALSAVELQNFRNFYSEGVL